MSRLWVRQAITTRYHGPTSTRGSRITARASAGSVTLPYDHSLDGVDNHALAAHNLANKLGWVGVWVGGMTHGSDCVWTQSAPDAQMVVE